MYDIYHISLLKQETTRKGRVDKNVRQINFDTDNNNKKYKVETICNSMVYAKKSELGYLLLGLYYLIF